MHKSVALGAVLQLIHDVSIELFRAEGVVSFRFRREALAL